MYGPDADDTSTSTWKTPDATIASVSPWFKAGDFVHSIPATTISVDWCNAVTAEIINAVAVAGVSPNKALTNQLANAVFAFGTPASSSAPGVKGMTMCDASNFYCCVATNTWKRVALTTW